MGILFQKIPRKAPTGISIVKAISSSRFIGAICFQITHALNNGSNTIQNLRGWAIDVFKVRS